MRRPRALSRIQEKERLLKQLADTKVPSRPDVLVVGGGAAGLMAGIAAAEEGATVVVVERDLECGRSILGTGNGRCNLANSRLDAAVYNAPDFVRDVTGASWLEDILTFFHESGLIITEEDEGRLYPLSHQAASVREVLVERARRANVILACGRKVRSVEHRGDRYLVEGQEVFGHEIRYTFSAPAAVLAQGHTRMLLPDVRQLALFGVLCPLAIEDPTLRDIDGRRSQAILTLKRDDTIVAVERGEVLFKKDALSGICIFNLSRVARARDTLNLDLLPDLSLDEARKYTHHTLSGVLDPVIANALIEREGSIDAALVRAKSWELNVRGLTDTNRAQVMRGGLILSDFSSTTLEAKEHPGLFAAGEALDVDGPCGGFNLAWAWKSGMVAGKNAAAFASR